MKTLSQYWRQGRIIGKFIVLPVLGTYTYRYHFTFPHANSRPADSLPLLQRFKPSHADARGPLEAWQNEVERSQWQTSQDIKQRYGGADFLADNQVIFNIKGNRYRLVVQVRYRGGLVVVEWIGTHAEYDKKKF